VLYERASGAEEDEELELAGLEGQMRRRPVVRGSFDP